MSARGASLPPLLEQSNRRDITRRAELVRIVAEIIVRGKTPVVTVQGLSEALAVPPQAATRIIERLVSAGVFVQTRHGVWKRVGP